MVVPRLLGFLVALAVLAPLTAQDLPPLGADDVVIEARADGYHLFIKQLPGVGSVLLTEAFERPDHKLATYALRSLGPNPVNDGEPRLLNGQFLRQPHGSLVSSTPKAWGNLGPSFEVLVTPEVEYGAATPGARYGRIDVRALLASEKPLWFSIRTFAKPHADYSGAYRDNAFELKSFLAQTLGRSSDAYEPGLYEDFGRLGAPYRTSGIQDALDRVHRTLERSGDSLELVVAVDTTKSMGANLQVVKQALLGPIREGVKKFRSFRIGLVFYRDYLEDYLTRTVAFSSDLDQVEEDLLTADARGGGDTPEAVVEAVWAGLTQFRWTAQNRILLVLGDAPQHPTPRGPITEEQVRERAKDEGVEVEMLMLPQTKS